MYRDDLSPLPPTPGNSDLTPSTSSAEGNAQAPLLPVDKTPSEANANPKDPSESLPSEEPKIREIRNARKRRTNPRLSRSTRAYIQPNYAAWVEKAIGEKRGRVDVEPYRPLIGVSFGTCGFASRIPDPMTGEILHTLSNGESDHVRALMFLPEHVRIFTQVAVDRPRAVRFAEEKGIPYPLYPDRVTPVLYSTDIFAVQRVNGSRRELAISVKSSRRLTRRQTELAKIEQACWLELGVEWEMRFREDAPRDRVVNVLWIENFHARSKWVPCRERWREIENTLYPLVSSGQPLNTSCHKVDAALGLNEGTSLTQVRFYLGSWIWTVDLDKRINPFAPLHILKRNLEPHA